ncbi:MAG: hypothetical protein AB7O38_23085 [Pirellulaceae bacterium]
MNRSSRIPRGPTVCGHKIIYIAMMAEAPLRKTCGNAADLLDRPADERFFRF